MSNSTACILFAALLAIRALIASSSKCISIPLDDARYWHACLMYYEDGVFHSTPSLKVESVKGMYASMIPPEPLTENWYKHLGSRRYLRDSLQAVQYQQDYPVEDIIIRKNPRQLGSTKWYTETWERDYLTSALSALLIFVAVLFEVLFHKLHKIASHTYQYGQFMMTPEEKDFAEKRELFGHPLMVVFIDRMGAEFMVLGFLAFCIWFFTQVGFMDWMASLPSGISVPTEGHQYTHLLEDLHMRLFLTMCLYFVLAARMVQGSNAAVQAFEAGREKCINQLLLNGFRDSVDDSDESLKTFKRWRRVFLDEDRGAVNTIFNWRETNPEAFKRVLKSLHIEQDPAKITLQTFKIEFEVHFSFCTFISFSVESAVADMVEMKGLAMFVILCLKVALAISHRFGHTTGKDFKPLLIIMAAVYIFSIHFLSRAFKKALDEKEYKPLPGWRSCSFIFKQQILDGATFKALQVILFFLCFSIAGVFMTIDFWVDLFARDSGTICIFLCSFFAYFALLIDLPRCLPDFAAVMALPPFFSEQDEEMVELVAALVVDTRMIAARSIAKDVALQAVDRTTLYSLECADTSTPLMDETPPMFSLSLSPFAQDARNLAMKQVTTSFKGSEVEMGLMQQPLRENSYH